MEKKTEPLSPEDFEPELVHIYNHCANPYGLAPELRFWWHPREGVWYWCAATSPGAACIALHRADDARIKRLFPKLYRKLLARRARKLRELGLK